MTATDLPGSPFTRLRVRMRGSEAERSRYTLHVSIGVLFSVLIVALGGVLITYSSEKHKSIALLTAHQLFDHVAQRTASSVGELYAPIDTLVDLTARLEPARSASTNERLQLLDFFAESLRRNSQLSAIYIGYGDGEFFLVRAVRKNPAVRASVAAPESTAFVVQSIEVDDSGVPHYVTQYFDDALNGISDELRFNSGYDPRARGWYQSAIRTPERITTGFYVFFTTQEIGTTVARRLPGGQGVVGADLTVNEVSSVLGAQTITPSTEIVVFDTNGTVLGYQDASNLVRLTGGGSGPNLREAHISDIDRPILEGLFQQFVAGARDTQLTVEDNEQVWFGAIAPLGGFLDVFIAMLVPETELFEELEALRGRSVLISLVVLALSLLLAWWISNRIASPARALASEAENIRRLKFDTPITVRSRVSEIDGLATTMAVMKEAIEHFTEIARALSAEKDFDKLLEMILREATVACSAEYGSVLLMSDDLGSLNPTLIRHNGAATGRPAAGSIDVRTAPVPMHDAQGAPRSDSLETQAVLTGDTMIVDDIEEEQRFDFAEIRERYLSEPGSSIRSLLVVPLKNRRDEVIGLLELVNAGTAATGRPATFRPEIASYVEALASNAAVALENQRLLKSQRALFDALIQIMAAAIDAKSPYTGGHCQRVPALTSMLAEAASRSDAPPFEDFNLTAETRYELHVASWLHDCGKVTTPESVVDKATKLETIYNRIHEIRLRFEVLLRDAEIEYYQALASGEHDEAVLGKKRDTRAKQIRDDFEFIAECNIGGEFMTPERASRVKAIAAQTWIRHLDDRIGISSEEEARKNRLPKPQLPVEEQLLSDKQEHLVYRNDSGKLWGENPFGFRMKVPEHEFNFGELHNLCIGRGTLTAEERFKVNDHIIQTIIMLRKLPFPRELRRVPELAGNHHEKLDGTGFPRRLGGDDLSVGERIMTIADIFEALTAGDRPYKKAKSLSESLRIMSRMRDDGHICPALFDLFLSSGVYRDYTSQFLHPEQVDEPDVSRFLGSSCRGDGHALG